MFEPILEILVKAAALLALGLLVGRALRGVSASRRHFVYGLTVVAALALAPITLAAPGWLTLELPVERPGSQEIAASIDGPFRTPSAEAVGRGLPVVPLAETLGDVQPVTRRPAGSPWPAVLGRTLIAIYLAGVLLLLGGLARSVVLLRTLARRATDVPKGDRRLGVLSRVCGDRRRPMRLAETSACSVPFVWGVRHPVILVPADSAAWPPRRLEAVLLHEIAHVRQFDVLLRVAAEVLCALQWLNPLTWMLARRLRADGEAACDDAVLAAGVEPTDYAGELLGLGIERRWHLRVAGAMSGGSPLGRRIEAVLDDRVARSAITRPQRWGATFFIGCCFAVLVAADWQERPPAPPAPRGEQVRTPTAAPPPHSGARGESGATVPDPNATPAVQLRWQSGQESGAAFLGGTIDLDADSRGEMGADAFLLLFHRAADGSIRSRSVWDGDDPGWVERDLTVVGGKLGSLGDRIRWRGTPLSTFANDAALSGVSGSVMTGLPATTEDGSRGSLVAGWQSGSDRIGLLACGAPGFGMDAGAARTLLQRTIDRGGDVDLAEGECLVAFAWNTDRRELRLFESYRALGGSTQIRFSDGARPLVDAGSAGWLRQLLSSGRTSLGLGP